ncbi:hypothetical protein ACIRP7_24615 [Streptomyces sp. NPDC102270]|uniref:hypothetical protein n=1 Tax=Streptomyces sp. NPDC102270 TaxID=3366150 RepID=UPI00381C4875
MGHEAVPLANIQAGTVSRMLPARPGEPGKIAVEPAATTSSALRELKATTTMGLLRHHTDRADDTDKPPEPAPGLAQLPALSASFRHAGLKVARTFEGTARPLPAGTEPTAYRIVQEALTDVTKHAAVDTARVRHVYRTDDLPVVVTNDGTAHRGGFEVVVELPYHPQAQAD